MTMKIFKKILAGIAILLLAILIIGFFLIRNISNRALPEYNRNIELTGISDEVVVYRDVHAVPHIFARNEHDLYVAVGYVMAQDRLWQMDLLRRVTLGRLSEIFGEDMVNTDALMRSLRMTEKSKFVLSRSDEPVIKALEAFAHGVNIFIEQQGKKLPPEFTILGYKPEPWLPEHSVNLIGYMAWDLTGAWSTEVILHKIRTVVEEEKFLELLPNLTVQKTNVHEIIDASEMEVRYSLLSHNNKLKEMGLAVFSGSNNWAVSGAKSTSGKPILANDMHLGLFSPGIWYQMHHVVEGKLNVTGVVLPGQPMVIAGHNERIAWGLTNVMLDDMDFYLETINPDNANQYKFNGEWKEIRKETETIHIKGGTSVEKEIKFTHRGPVISDYKKVTDQVISMRWIGNEYSNELRTVYLLNRASNWEDFRNALTTFIAVSQNLNYADVDGNIGLQTSAGIPVRKGNGVFIYPGETDEYDWKGIVPFEDLPSTYNPASNTVSSANNKTVSDDYPHYISHWFDPPNRIDRIREMLDSGEQLSIDDFKKMQSDHESKLVERYLGDLIGVVSSVSALTENERTALGFLQDWNMVLDVKSSAAPVFEKFYITFVKNLLKDEMGDDFYLEFIGDKILVRNIFDHAWRNRNSAWIDNITTEKTETFEEIVLLSFKESVSWLEETINKNPEKWEWGKIHTITLKHPMGGVNILAKIFSLNKGPYPIGGSFHTVAPYSYSFKNPFVVNHGASQRHIFDLSDWDKSLVVIPTGTSGIPASKYYCDQTKMYLENNYKTDNFTERAVISTTRYVTKFLPAGDK